MQTFFSEVSLYLSFTQVNHSIWVLSSFHDIAYDSMIYIQSGGSPGEHNIYLFRLSLVDNEHRIVSDMTDGQPYDK